MTVTRSRSCALLLLLACGGSGGGDGSDRSDSDGGGDPGIDGGPFVCMAGSGGSCAGCVREKCSDLLDICEQNDACACMADCLGEGGVGGVPDCLASHDLTSRPPGFGALEECVGVACPDGDECSTPDGWEPPSDVACPGSAAGIGGGSLPDCSIDPDLPFDPDGEILQLASADQDICARIERRNDGSGTMANIDWTLLEMRVGPLEQVAAVDQADGCWYSSHHNFRDWIHAWSGARHFDLVLKEYGHGGERTYDLYVFEDGPVDTGDCAASADGTGCIDGPIELFPVNP